MSKPPAFISVDLWKLQSHSARRGLVVAAAITIETGGLLYLYGGRLSTAWNQAHAVSESYRVSGVGGGSYLPLSGRSQGRIDSGSGPLELHRIAPRPFVPESRSLTANRLPAHSLLLSANEPGADGQKLRMRTIGGSATLSEVADMPSTPSAARLAVDFSRTAAPGGSGNSAWSSGRRINHAPAGENALSFAGKGTFGPSGDAPGRHVPADSRSGSALAQNSSLALTRSPLFTGDTAPPATLTADYTDTNNSGTTETDGGNHNLNGYVLTYNGNSNFVVQGVISGSSITGRMVMSGTGDLALYGNNTFTGGTTLNGGRILIDNNNALGSGAITANSGQIRADNQGRTLGNQLLLNGSLSVGQLTTFTGVVDVLANSTISEVDPTSAGAGYATFNGNFSGFYGLTFTAADSTGTVYLGGNNTYKGGTTITAGNVIATSTSAFGTGAITLAPAAPTAGQAGNGGSDGAAGSDSASLSVQGAIPLSSITVNSQQGAAGGNVYVYTGGGAGGNAGSISISDGLSDAVRSGQTSSFYAGAGGTGGNAIRVPQGDQGGGGGSGSAFSLALSASGAIANGGALNLYAGAGGSAGQTGEDGWSGSGGTGGAVVLTLAASNALASGSSVSLLAGNGYAGVQAYDADGRCFGGSGGSVTVQLIASNPIASGAGLVLTAGNGGNGGNASYYTNGNPGGAGGSATVLESNGATLSSGSLTLVGGTNGQTGAAGYLGSGGSPGKGGLASLVLSSDNSGGTNYTNYTADVTFKANDGGASLLMGGNSLTLGGIDSTGTGGGTISSDGSAGVSFFLGTDNANHSFSGSIQDGSGKGTSALTLVKVGTGTQILSGNDIYTGGTALFGGTLTLGSNSALGSGYVNVYNGILSLNGNTAAAMSLAGNGGVIENGGTVVARLNDSQTSNTSFSGTIADGGSGTLSLGMTGTGDLALYGTNTYSGGTTLSAGRLLIDNNSALGTGAITITGGQIRADNAARTLSNALIVDGPLNVGQLTTFTGKVTLGTNSTLNEVDPFGGGGGYATFSGAIGGCYSLTTTASSGSGEIILTGTNTYTGGTTVASGTLQLGDGAAATGSVVGNIADNSALVFANPGALGYGGIISGNGTVTKTGSGTLTLSGANTFSGGAAISAGTVVASGSALGAGAVTIASGATLAVGEAANGALTAITTHALSAASLVVATGSTTPLLIFNLGASGTSDVLNLTGSGNELTFSGSGTFDISFASATGKALGAGTYDLLNFATPESLSSAPLVSQYKASPTGNLADVKGGTSGMGTFLYTLSGGNVTGLTYTITGADTTPEPSALLLALPGLLGMVGLCAVRRRRI